jgi:hypothetical protein
LRRKEHGLDSHFARVQSVTNLVIFWAIQHFFRLANYCLDSSGYAPHLIEPASDMRCGAQSQSQDYEGVACKFGRRTKAPAYIFSGSRNAVVAAGSVLTITLLNGAERSQTPSSHVIERFSEAEWEFNL